MKCLEQELHEYICDLCVAKEIPLEIHWRCFGDPSVFYKDGQEFTIACVSYYASDVEDIKSLLIEYIEEMWECEEVWGNTSRSNYRVAIYVMDIVDKDGWYDVVIGGAISDG